MSAGRRCARRTAWCSPAFPCDFRLDYGKHVGKLGHADRRESQRQGAHLNRSPDDRRCGDAADVPGTLSGRVRPARAAAAGSTPASSATTRARRRSRGKAASPPARTSNPIALLPRLEAELADDSVLVVDGGDFVATAVVRAAAARSRCRGSTPACSAPWAWARGFAVGAARCARRPRCGSIYGDGSSAYSLNEFDTFARHGMGPIAVIGNDASWTQIARDQVTLLAATWAPSSPAPRITKSRRALAPRASTCGGASEVRPRA